MTIRELEKQTREDLLHTLLGLDCLAQELTHVIQGAYEALLDDEVPLALDILRDFAFAYPPLSRRSRVAPPGNGNGP